MQCPKRTSSNAVYRQQQQCYLLLQILILYKILLTFCAQKRRFLASELEIIIHTPELQKLHSPSNSTTADLAPSNTACSTPPFTCASPQNQLFFARTRQRQHATQNRVFIHPLLKKNNNNNSSSKFNTTPRGGRVVNLTLHLVFFSCLL